MRTQKAKMACAIVLVAGTMVPFLSTRPAPVRADGEIVDPAAPPKQRCLLLSSGKVVRGIVEKVGKQYRLRRNAGAIYYDENQVVMVVDTMREVYDRKREGLPGHDILAHMELSQWCIEEKMWDEALLEVNQILSVDPENDPALHRREFLQKQIDKLAAGPGVKPGLVRSGRIHSDHKKVIQRWKEGFGDELFGNYVQIEKIVANRCAAAACHGSMRYEGKFKIVVQEHGKVDQRVTARNLQSVQATIDLQSPQRSALLYYAVNAHGNAAVPPFGGINDPLYLELHNWVHRVSHRFGAADIADARPMDKPIDVSAPQPPRGFGSSRPANVDPARGMRPGKPSLPPGDDIESLRPGFGGVADDDIESGSRPIMIPRQKKPGPVSEGLVDPAAPVAKPKSTGSDPLDPSAFNATVKPPSKSSSEPTTKSIEPPQKPVSSPKE